MKTVLVYRLGHLTFYCVYIYVLTVTPFFSQEFLHFDRMRLHFIAELLSLVSIHLLDINNEKSPIDYVVLLN